MKLRGLVSACSPFSSDVNLSVQNNGTIPTYKSSLYWKNKENICKFFGDLKCKYNLNTPEDWNSITKKHIQSNGGWGLLKEYTIYEIKCMACPEGKSIFNNPKQPPKYWESKENILNFLSLLGQKYKLETPEDWNLITRNYIISNGGSRLLAKYSIFELKCMACPEGKSIFNNPRQPPRYWENKENILNFLSVLKQKYKLESLEDWDSITQKHIQANGGSSLLVNYSIYELKCMACPEGKSFFKNPKQKSGYWENKENIKKFLDDIRDKYKLKSPEDWNLVTQKHIKSNGGAALFPKYSMFELKSMACPEGESVFDKPNQTLGYWEKQENIQNFLSKIKEKYNLTTPDDWNSITHQIIVDNGGGSLVSKYSMFEIKCMACPEGKSIFNRKVKPKKSSGYWKNQENIYQFLHEIKEKYNLKTPEDWNTVTKQQFQSNGGSTLLEKYSVYKLKCMACPEGKSIFNNPKQTPGYWENQENVQNFLSTLREKYNLHTPDDWNSITTNQIQSNGGGTLITKYSMFEIKCMACPEGKSIFNNPKQSPGYWENRENILNFLSEIKEKYNLYTPKDWNSINQQIINDNGGSSLLSKYSMFEIKCMACPEGQSLFDVPKQNKIDPEYWNSEINRNNFFLKLKNKYHLQTPLDWKRLSKNQIISQGGNWLFKDNNMNYSIPFEGTNSSDITFIPLKDLISESINASKRSSQRWLFLQVQKLFPGEEIVEDYFHSEVSRSTGSHVQFDIFMIERNIAIEYHGKQHYEDIPSGFCNLEVYKHRDIEKEKLCSEHKIQLIVIPYWWDNKLDSLRTTLYSKIK